MRHNTLLVAVALLAALHILGLGATASNAAARPRVGLVLSGGGARGLAEIGAIKVIEEAGVPIDVVAGTSMGAIVGALYAMGYSPDDIERIVVTADWSDLLSDRLERCQLPMKNRKKDDRYLFSFPVVEGRVRLPAGVINGQKIYNLFVKLAWPMLEIADFKKLPRPFSCVATDIATGDAVALDHGYLPDALRASMAIPSLFTPVRVGGRLLVDGGVRRNLPADDAANLGADIVIGVDVSHGLLPAEKLQTLVDIFDQTLDLAEAPEHQKQRARCDILITPATEKYQLLDFSKVRELVRLGETAARAHMGELRALADSLRALSSLTAAPDSSGSLSSPPAAGLDSLGRRAAPAGGPPAPARLDSASFQPVHIDEIEVRGLRRVPTRFVLAELDVKPPASVTADELDQAVQRLYSSGFFMSLSYRFEPTEAGRKLVIDVRENSGIILKTGLRYDSYWGASLLLNTSLRNRLGHGSQLDFELLLSDRKRFTAEYAAHTGIRRSAGFRLDADYINDHIDEYQSNRRVSRWHTESTRGGFFLETLLSRVFYAAAGLNMDWYETRPDIAPAALGKETGRIALASGDLWFDTLDRSWFPKSGFLLRIRGEAAGRTLGGTASFNRAFAAGELAVPVMRRVTVRGSAFLGVTEAGPAPRHYNFFLGGINSCAVFQGDRTASFYGYHNQEISGPNAFTADVDIQVEPARRWYLTASANVGSADKTRGTLFKKSALHAGGALTLGLETPVGPAAFSLAYSKRNKTETFLTIGFLF